MLTYKQWGCDDVYLAVIWWTSGQHYCQHNLINYCRRPRCSCWPFFLVQLTLVTPQFTHEVSELKLCSLLSLFMSHHLTVCACHGSWWSLNVEHVMYNTSMLKGQKYDYRKMSQVADYFVCFPFFFSTLYFPYWRINNYVFDFCTTQTNVQPKQMRPNKNL
jgi:hypothetical protein